MIVKLPCASCLGWWVCGCVRSLRTQQRALVKCQIILVQLFAGLRIPLDQSPGLFGLAYGYVSNDLFILVMIELAACNCFPGCGFATVFYGEFDPGSG